MKKQEIKVENETDVHSQLLKEVQAIRKDIHIYSKGESFKKRFLLGVVGGFGTVLGATVLVSLLIIVLNQFATIDVLKPIVERVIEIVDSKE